MTDNFPKLIIDNELQIQEAQRQKYKKSTCMHSIFKLQNIKDKEQLLKETEC